MSEEPLYCTTCGAEDKDCEHWQTDNGIGPFCESAFIHEWTDEDDTTARCLHCGMRGRLHVLKVERTGEW